MAKSYRLAELADLLDARLDGDANCLISGLANLDRAQENQISFLSSAKYAASLSECLASAVVLKPSEADAFTGNKLLSEEPYLCYAKLSRLFETRRKRQVGIHPSAVIEEGVTLGANVAIGPHCHVGAGAVIGDDVELYAGVSVGDEAKVGARSILFSNVVIYHQVELGCDVIIHANATIGADGFGFAPSADGWQKIHQIGRVLIGDRVEVGANTTIDRGAIEDTVIADGVIIDDQVHVAHNVSVGEGSAIAGCTGIAGSTDIGKQCQIAGGVGINGHISIADGTYFHGGTVVTKGNKVAGQFASASPLLDIPQWRKASVRYKQLDELFNRVKQLEKQLNEK
ncbi:UDP-3-O-(3-hydroxymyristoyl)glucosamine N-acyltransferase [Agaribacterium sp. ZY112]|uniref:UDP-3-O-(3-hydroxymyristoyl)glucosamine N-acyltransferase n=1 Tax=Agaribacterium sp. ZY112 TaxID=3233574 RepID=UPI00352516C5